MAAKTHKIENPQALELVREMARVEDQLQKDTSDIKKRMTELHTTANKKLDALVESILALTGLPLETHGSIDSTYLEDHGLAFFQEHDQCGCNGPRTLAELLGLGGPPPESLQPKKPTQTH